MVGLVIALIKQVIKAHCFNRLVGFLFEILHLLHMILSNFGLFLFDLIVNYLKGFDFIIVAFLFILIIFLSTHFSGPLIYLLYTMYLNISIYIMHDKLLKEKS